MNDFQASVSGNVATAVRHRVAASGAHVADFRLASTRSWRGRDGDHREATSFVTVRCFGPLADNAASSLEVGNPVVAVGRLEVVEHVREGQRYRYVVLVAAGLGPNLALGTTTYRRTVAAGGRPTSSQPPPSSPSPAAPAA